MISSIRLKIRSQSDRIHFYAILILFLTLSFISIYYFLLFILYILYISKKKIINIKTIAIILTVVVIIWLPNYLYKENLNQESFIGIIEEIEYNDTYTKIIVKKGFKKVLVYYYDSDFNYNIGDKLKFIGKFEDILDNGTFEYNKYLKSKGIYSKFILNDSIYIKHNYTLKSVTNSILNYYKNNINKDSFNYFKSLVLGLNLDENLEDSVSKIGISYLFCISGYHLSIINLFFLKILKKIEVSDSKSTIIRLIILFIYVSICNFSAGILRAYLMIFFIELSKKFNLNFETLDSFSLTFIVMILINPYYLYQMSFKLSFLVTFFIIMSHTILKNKNKIVSNYLISLIAFIVSLPLTVSISNSFNLTTILISPIFLSIFTYVILPISYVLIILPQVSPLTDIIFKLFTSLIDIFKDIDILSFRTRSFKNIEIIIYYIIVFYLLISIENKKKLKIPIILLVSFISFITLSIKLYPYDRVIMLNCGQGDSILISLKGEETNILIDSYNNLDELKEIGIHKLDAILITHSDTDHIGTLNDCIAEFGCDTLITSFYDKSSEIDKAIKNVKYHKKVKGGDTVYINSLKLNILGPVIKSDNINNNSIIFSTIINDTSFLFTGDMEEEEEISVFNKNMKFDILKVPHHGSKTSMSNIFLKYVKFDKALISAGVNNKFNFPNEETIKKLEGIDTYITKDNFRVTVNIFKKGYDIKTQKGKTKYLNLIDKSWINLKYRKRFHKSIDNLI